MIASAAEPASVEAAGPADDAAARLFARVQPLLKTRCLACHGDGMKLEAELDLRTREGMLRGGQSQEAAIVPGQPARSLLVTAIAWIDKSLQMPPKENDRLSADEIEVFRQWVAAGAPWPNAPVAGGDTWSGEGPADGVRVATSGGREPGWTHRRYAAGDIWANRPIGRPPIPAGDPMTHPLDAFLDAALAATKIEPAPPADKRTLVRRAAFDLTGLPPSPAEIESFLADNSPRAWESLVDRLLASPRYGEQAARHWLDVVRYADTSGFSNDYERPNAWRYRDYVVRSFNSDKPYDRFVLEQIAGDELDPNDGEAMLATGYLRMGPWEHTGMSVAAVTRQQFLDDVTNSMGVTFLAQGLRCAKCHDHKFDPVPTQDYYRVLAVFAGTQFADRKVPFLPEENAASFERFKVDATRQLKELSLRALPGSNGGDSFGRINNKRQEYFKRAMNRYEPVAFSVEEGSSPAVHILTGGALETPGERVTPGILTAVHGVGGTLEAGALDIIPRGSQGGRLALARWIASPKNPLTARVLVNRVWQQHFGTGLVATPNNFGKMGARPSHAELLDWLAGWFIDEGWSIKRLHQLIMTSQAYQRSGAHPRPELLAREDASNRLLAHYPPRRLAAEEIRDAMLAISGELNLEMGGPGVFPDVHDEVALQPRHIMGGIAPAYSPSPLPADRHRRTLYAYRYRGLDDPLLEVLNKPGSDASCERRDETTVAPQAFALFNGRFSHGRALAMAQRLATASPDRTRQVARAFALVYGRPPSEAEMELCTEHVERMTEHHRRHEPVVVVRPEKVIRQMIAEQTGELFSWEEQLDTAAYVPDLAPSDVDPATRGLAELCLVLLNSNEFVYVY
jgi:hypothetical protein